MKALVTGVSRGIGRSICVQLASDAMARGESVSIAACGTGRSGDLTATVEELNKAGARAIAVTGDLTDAETPARLVREAIAFCDGLDVLVCNAGFPILSTLREIKVRHWDLMFAINVRSALLLGREAFDALKASKGAICAIGSLASEQPEPDLAGYSASKAALAMLVKEMALEWASAAIRVNCVSPGITRSRSTETAFANPEIVRARNETTPLGRLGEPEDIAALVSFLVGPNSSYITGRNFVVDGGRGLLSATPAGKKPY